MRRALLVGIDDYPGSPLYGCVNDATRVRDLLIRHHDGAPNFECRMLVAPSQRIERATLRRAISELFSSRADVALLFFAGHGTVNNLGGYLVTPDARQYDEGVSMIDVLTLANKSPAGEVVIILDCCHSGALGQAPELANDRAVIREGVSVLSACRDVETAAEENGGGLFTVLVCDALHGGAADVCGAVTVASTYAYVDQTLGAWQQRPLFKGHLSRLMSLRQCEPALPMAVLRRLPEYFKKATTDLRLDPSYEPTALPRDEANERAFGDLQKCRAARLVDPVGAEHMYDAAMNSTACRLTPLGRFYWRLANSGKL